MVCLVAAVSDAGTGAVAGPLWRSFAGVRLRSLRVSAQLNPEE
jgi:hypothetical protein